jgi:DNA-binding MarR family transcriptional regulator
MLDVTAIHAVLRRLEAKGYVSSSMGGATSERGGRRKRFFVLTQAGRHVLEEIMNVRTALYNKISTVSFSGS